MSDPLRPTAPAVELIDVQIATPPNGAKVFALGRGGVIAQVVWGKDSATFFMAWMPYPQIPLSVKTRLSQMRAPAVNAVNPKE